MKVKKSYLIEVSNCSSLSEENKTIKNLDIAPDGCTRYQFMNLVMSSKESIPFFRRIWDEGYRKQLIIEEPNSNLNSMLP